MPLITRRATLALGAGAASTALPRFALGQADARPSITVAVQKVSNTNTLDPLREQSNVGERIFFTSMWEGLIGRDYLGDLGPVPMLATGWSRVDASVVDLTLRQGVMFHNGDEMTAEDVAFSFGPERMFGRTPATAQGRTIPMREVNPAFGTKEIPPEITAVARRFFPALVKVEPLDKYRVRFTNATPDVTLEGRISSSGATIVSRRDFTEAKSYLEWARKPATTGPYRVAEFLPDNRLVLEAHDGYWGGRPPLKRIRFVEVPEVSSRINGLYAGDYQFACDIPPDQIAAVEARPGLEVKGGTVVNHRLTTFDKTNAQLADPLVRRAFTHAIDRQAIIDSLWDGRTTVPKGLQWPFYGPMLVDDWTVPAFDPDLARKLLKQANYKGDPIPYRLLNNYYTNQTANAQVLVEMWKAVGLNVDIGMKENWSQILERGPSRAVRDWSNSASFNDPVSSLVTQHGPNGQQQQVGEYSNAEFNTLSVELETSTDMARRKQVFRRMLEIAEREDPAYTVLHQNATFTGKAKSIRWKAAPAFAMDFRPGNFSA